MNSFKKILIAILSVAALTGTIGLFNSTQSHAINSNTGFNFNKLFKGLFPPCGHNTKKQRFVVSKGGTQVCDNTTGLYWQQSPSTDIFMWEGAIAHCDALNTSGKKNRRPWRLPEVKEYLTLVDYSEANQATALNTPNGPFQNVQAATLYWAATELASDDMSAWLVGFEFGDVGSFSKNSTNLAWCVKDGKKRLGAF